MQQQDIVTLTAVAWFSDPDRHGDHEGQGRGLVTLTAMVVMRVKGVVSCPLTQ